MMGNTIHLSWGDFVRQDIESFVDLHRVAIDDFSLKAMKVIQTGR